MNRINPSRKKLLNRDDRAGNGGSGGRAGKGVVREVTVSATEQLTPHLKRITLTGSALADFPDNQQGAYVKVRVEQDSEKVALRSYTIQGFDKKKQLLVLDFVVNLHEGPATNWASKVAVGDQVSFGGPGPRKMDSFDASTYLLVGDLTSVNAVIAYAKFIQSKATVYAFIEAPSTDDFIEIEWPANVQAHWYLSEKGVHDAIINAVKDIKALPADTHVFIASEAGVFRELRAYMRDELKLPGDQLFASAYWKQGKDSDQLSVEKRQDTI